MITKVLFRECGLIVACFKGYIELFDKVDFASKGVWDNQTDVVAASQTKKQHGTHSAIGPERIQAGQEDILFGELLTPVSFSNGTASAARRASGS